MLVFRKENQNFPPELTSSIEHQTYTNPHYLNKPNEHIQPSQTLLPPRLRNSTASYERGLKVETEPSTVGRYRAPKPVWIVYIEP